jgi:hypothetical protein
MSNSVTITQTCEKRCEFFVSISAQFPGLEWVGETEDGRSAMPPESLMAAGWTSFVKS